MTFDGCRAKLRRANQHFETIKDDIETFLTNHECAVVVEQQRNGTYVARVKNPPVIPAEDWALMIGDCVHALRCALDYIVWELAGADVGDTETLFPIFETRAGWNTKAERRIKRLTNEVRLAIEEVQPFVGPNPVKNALNVIRVLDDRDKHKLLAVVALIPSRLFLRFDEKDVKPESFTTFDGPLIHDAIVAEFLPAEGAPPRMNVEAHFHPLIAFGETMGIGSRIDVVATITVLIQQVAVIADAFSRFIK